jgi:hypothetical protein
MEGGTMGLDLFRTRRQVEKSSLRKSLKKGAIGIHTKYLRI